MSCRPLGRASSAAGTRVWTKPGFGKATIGAKGDTFRTSLGFGDPIAAECSFSSGAAPPPPR